MEIVNIHNIFYWDLFSRLSAKNISSSYPVNFFLLFAPHGAWGLHSQPPTNSVQSGHFRLTPRETHCLNIFLDCSSPGGFWSALLSFLLRGPSKSFPWNSIVNILKICPSHRRRRLLIVVWIGSEFVLACNSKFEMGQKIRQILRMHPLWNASISWKSVSTTCQHSDPYNSNDLTILL